jgi:hypothetical protein
MKSIPPIRIPPVRRGVGFLGGVLVDNTVVLADGDVAMFGFTHDEEDLADECEAAFKAFAVGAVDAVDAVDAVEFEATRTSLLRVVMYPAENETDWLLRPLFAMEAACLAEEVPVDIGAPAFAVGAALALALELVTVPALALALAFAPASE